MIKNILLSSFIFFAQLIQAQQFEKLFSYSTGNNTYEYANAGIELSNGNYLIAINNKLLCLSSNGDSLWTRTYNYLGPITKLFRDQNNKLMLASTVGKMHFVSINENNGDTSNPFLAPKQFSNSGYEIYDVAVLPGGDYVLAFSNGGGQAGSLQRFTPKSTVLKWNNDYAGQTWKPRSVIIDDTNIVAAGFKAGANNRYGIRVSKISANNVTIWTKTYLRDAAYGDRGVGIQKNSKGQYLVANSWNVETKLVPAVLVLSNAGDSLTLHSLSTVKGSFNYGMMHSLQPSSNGFYASGYLNYNTKAPDSSSKSNGYMSVFSIMDDGKIKSYAAFNKSSFHLDPNSEYSGCEGWGTWCFETKDKHYMLIGTGSILEKNPTGVGMVARYRGYVAKSNSLDLVSIKNGMAPLGFSIFPVPATHNLSIKLDVIPSNYSISIFDAYGKLLLEHKNNQDRLSQLDISMLNNGIYFLQILDSKGNRGIRKFVVTKENK